MKKSFRPGDLVKLKSGGQGMTVVKYLTRTDEHLPDEKYVSVTWVEEKKIRTTKYYETHLVKA